MNWEKSSPELVELFRALAPADPRIEQKPMFGWPSYFVNGNLCAGLHQQCFLFRLSEKDAAALLKLDGASPFEPMPGRRMKGYVLLSNPLGRDRKELARWIKRSLEFAGALPPKTKAKPAKKAK